MMTAIVAATAAVTVLVSTGLDRSTSGSDQVISAPDTTTSTSSSTTSTTGLSSAATQVSGSVSAVVVDGAVLDPRELATPITVTAERGFGNGGRITGVTVEGTPATIEWDAGRPFVLSSGGALVLDPLRLELVPEGLRVQLSGAVHTVRPGTYHLDTPVAVGTSGVAAARESVVFEAADGATFEGRGDASLVLSGEEARRVLGPGEVHLEGTLELVEESGSREVTKLDAGEGPFELTLTPVPGGGWTVEGLLGGALTAT